MKLSIPEMYELANTKIKSRWTDKRYWPWLISMWAVGEGRMVFEFGIGSPMSLMIGVTDTGEVAELESSIC